MTVEEQAVNDIQRMLPILDSEFGSAVFIFLIQCLIKLFFTIVFHKIFFTVVYPLSYFVLKMKTTKK